MANPPAKHTATVLDFEKLRKRRKSRGPLGKTGEVVMLSRQRMLPDLRPEEVRNAT